MYDIEGDVVDSQLNISRAFSFITNVLKSDVPDAFGDEAFEGVLKQRFIAHRSREYWFRQRKIQEAQTKNGGHLICEVPNCEFDFRERYGKLGDGYAQVHHKKPLGFAPAKGFKVPLKDLAVVCANCHAMIHRGGKCLPLEGLIPRRLPPMPPRRLTRAPAI
jgi:predicted HNH restriction endonuclease